MKAFVTRALAALPLAIAMAFAVGSTLGAQELTANPGAWRPLVSADLREELPDNLTYIDVWKDALVANNKAFEAKGSTLVGGRNAPASDAHVVVRGSARTIVLTTLDTESGCKPAEFSYPADVTIKICPTRLVVFEGAVANTTELPANCYLESEPKSSAAPNDAASYAAYDTITKTIKIGLIVNHRAIDECVRFIPTSQ
jgi:hypothetical protein